MEGKEEVSSFAKVSLEQRAPVESQNGGRMNEEISSITRHPTAGEQGRGSGGWKVARAGGMAWGTCREPGTEDRNYFVPFQQWPLPMATSSHGTMSFRSCNVFTGSSTSPTQRPAITEGWRLLSFPDSITAFKL